MRRKIALAAIVAVVGLAGCGQHGQQEQRAMEVTQGSSSEGGKEETVKVNPELNEEAVELAVRQIFAETVGMSRKAIAGKESSNTGGEDIKEAVDEFYRKYCTEEFKKIQADCAKKEEAYKAAGHQDYWMTAYFRLPWGELMIDSVKKVTVESFSATPPKANVNVIVPYYVLNDECHDCEGWDDYPIQWRMVIEGGKWKIDNILIDEGTEGEYNYKGSMQEVLEAEDLSKISNGGEGGDVVEYVEMNEEELQKLKEKIAEHEDDMMLTGGKANYFGNGFKYTKELYNEDCDGYCDVITTYVYVYRMTDGGWKVYETAEAVFGSEGQAAESGFNSGFIIYTYRDGRLEEVKEDWQEGLGKITDVEFTAEGFSLKHNPVIDGEVVEGVGENMEWDGDRMVVNNG